MNALSVHAHRLTFFCKPYNVLVVVILQFLTSSSSISSIWVWFFKIISCFIDFSKIFYGMPVVIYRRRVENGVKFMFGNGHTSTARPLMCMSWLSQDNLGFIVAVVVWCIKAFKFLQQWIDITCHHLRHRLLKTRVWDIDSWTDDGCSQKKGLSKAG